MFQFVLGVFLHNTFSRVFQEYLKIVLWGLQGCFRLISRLFMGGILGVLPRVSRECYTSVSEVCEK